MRSVGRYWRDDRGVVALEWAIVMAMSVTILSILVGIGADALSQIAAASAGVLARLEGDIADLTELVTRMERACPGSGS